VGPSGDHDLLVAALLIPGELSRRLRLLNNSEIAQLLDDEVWENILAPEATVCVEASLRFRTIPRACCWLLFGIVGWLLCEVAFAVSFRFVPHCESRLGLWMALFPFAAYFPLVPTWLWRRRHV
jgi:hypothetical protein